MSEQDRQVGKENNILIKCLKCGFEDKPENFNAILTYEKSGKLFYQEIYVQCPVCETTVYGWHFSLRTTMTVSHLLAVTGEEAKTPEEAERVFWKKLELLRKKYGRKVQHLST